MGAALFEVQDTRIIYLLEVLLHGSTQVGGWTAKKIHRIVLTAFRFPDKAYGLNQLRCDLRKLKGRGLLEHDANRYAYRLTLKGVQVATLFLFFQKRLCGPLCQQPLSPSTPSSTPTSNRNELTVPSASLPISVYRNQSVGYLAGVTGVVVNTGLEF